MVPVVVPLGVGDGQELSSMATQAADCPFLFTPFQLSLALEE